MTQIISAPGRVQRVGQPGLAALRRARWQHRQVARRFFGIVALFRSAGGDLRSGFWWYLPVLLLCWALGAAIARGFSEPCDRALRRRWLPRRGEAGAFELQPSLGDSSAG